MFRIEDDDRGRRRTSRRIKYIRRVLRINDIDTGGREEGAEGLKVSQGCLRLKILIYKRENRND